MILQDEEHRGTGFGGGRFPSFFLPVFPHQLTCSTVRTLNLKEDMPTVAVAMARLERELNLARSSRVSVLKIIHGYGSSGRGGDIRIALQKALVEKTQSGEIQTVIFGEDWRISNEASWALIKKWPELKQDSDLGRENRGITIVVL